MSQELSESTEEVEDVFDSQLVVTLKPLNESARWAVFNLHNSKWFQGQRPAVQLQAMGRRQKTPNSDDDEDPTPRLEMRFSDDLRDPTRGFTFGRDPHVCDVVIAAPDNTDFSKRHFSIAYNTRRDLILRDYSTWGSAVSYEGRLEDISKNNFTWILFEDIDSIKAIIGRRESTTSTTVNFEIVLEDHSNHVGKHTKARERFIEECRVTLPPVQALHLQTMPQTDRPTQSDTSAALSEALYLEDEIGSGGSGAVYVSRNVSNNEHTAVKVIEKQMFEYQNELHILSELDHPHIVRFLGLVMRENPAYRMEYAQLGDLEINYKLTSSAELLKTLRDVLDAVKYIHEKGITHRDIKPSNILIFQEEPFSVKLADMGLATKEKVFTSTDGSRLYMPPEQSDPFREADQKVDIWAIGIVAMRLLMGFLPSEKEEEDYCQTLRNTLAQYAERYSIAKFILENMLQLDPKDRKTAFDCFTGVSFILESASENDSLIFAIPVQSDLYGISDQDTVLADARFSPDHGEEQAARPQLDPGALKADYEAARQANPDMSQSQLDEMLLENAVRHKRGKHPFSQDEYLEVKRRRLETGEGPETWPESEHGDEGEEEDTEESDSMDEDDQDEDDGPEEQGVHNEQGDEDLQEDQEQGEVSASEEE